MNANWQTFLHTQAINSVHTDIEQALCPVTQLAVLTVSGQDAAQFLQGQITCNVHEITETQSRLGALCNPKGRVISTFLLCKTQHEFLLLLPQTLLQTVKERLQKYILRAKVTLTDSSDVYALFGVMTESENPFLATESNNDNLQIYFKQRYLIIAKPEPAITLWKNYHDQGFLLQEADYWTYLDILQGIPWLNISNSEHYIPQMLNLDNLGAISFNKGCYTGQEIVARTHYLGKAKRVLLLAECLTKTPEIHSSIINAQGQVIGNVLLAAQHKLLIVLHTDTEITQLQLKDYNQAFLTLLTEPHE